MKISVRSVDNIDKLCLWINSICVDIKLFLELYSKNQNPYANKAKSLLKEFSLLDTDNFLENEKSNELFEDINLLIKTAFLSCDKFIFESSRIDDAAPYKSPVPNPPLMFGLAGNCPRKWREKGEVVPIYPVGYQRPANSITGNNCITELSKDTTSFRCACELGVVIGKEGSCIKKEDAFDHVFGFTCVNDMISNHWKDFAAKKAKSKEPGFPELLATSYYGRGTDSFAPVGPWIVTKDEVSDPYNLLFYTRFNNTLRDRSYTNAMVVSIESTIEYLSSFMTLKPGSIIHMGTMGIDGITIPENLKLGRDDYVEVEIEHVGCLRTYFKDMRSF